MSRLSDINNSYGKTFSFAAANTYSTNVLNASKLPASTMIVASPQEDGEDIGQHSLLVTDYNGEAVRLTYDITAGNGLNFSNDALELSIDNDTIIEDNGKLVATLANYADSTTVKSSDGKIKIDSPSLGKASSSSQGLAKVDGRTIKSDNGTIYVETSALDIATGTSKGIAHGDNRTIKSANGVISVISNGLDKASATTYGVLKVDNSTLKSDNGKIYTTHELLKDLDKNGLKLAKADNDTLLQHNGVISVNEDAIPYASELTRGKVKIDESQFYVDNAGVLHPRPTDSTVIVYDYDEAISLLEEKTTSLEETVSNGLVSNEPEIYSLACDETTTSALAKPEYLEEPINMSLQHVYVSLNVITNCDFRISIRYDDNEPPVVELDDINYANEIKKSGIEAIDFTWPSTNMKEKNVIILFSAKNFYSSTLGKNKTTKLTISVESVEDRTISKQIVYSIIRYNSAFKHDETEYEETATAVVESSETFMINTEDSYVLVTIDDGTQWNQIKYSLNDVIPRSDLDNSPDENILLHGVYTDKNTMTEKYFEAKILKDKLNSPIPVNSGETYAIYVYCHNDEGEDLFYPINYEIKDPNEVIVNPRSLTVYAMHAAGFYIWDKTVVDENLNTSIQYYIEDSRNACTWNEKIQNSYIFDGEYTYQAARESSNSIARISDGSSNLISFVPENQSYAYAYFNDSIDSMNIYFMHHTKAEAGMTKEQIISYSASLSISYKNVGINIDYCIDEVEKYVSSSINGLRVHGKIRYAYQIDDGNLEYADMTRFDSSKLVPVKINIENVEGISPHYDPQNITDHFNDFTIIKSNLVDFSDQTISYSLSYLYDAALGYQFTTGNGSYAVDYIYDPILSVSSGIAINDSNGSDVSVKIDNPYYEISGLLNVEDYEPTKMIVAYQAIVQNIGAPSIDTRENDFAISVNSSNPNVYTTYSFYRYDVETQSFKNKGTYYGTINNAAYESPYLSDTLVVAYNSMNNTYSSIEGFYYFNSQMQTPEVDNYINYMECDGNSINIISYSSITNKEYHRLDKIGDAYSFFTGDTYFREHYDVGNNFNGSSNLTIKSSFIYNLSYSNDTVSQNGHEFSLVEFVPSLVSATQIDLDNNYIKRYSGDNGSNSIHAICKLYNSNGDPITVSYSNNALTLENNNTFEASHILQAQSVSSDGLALSKEHFYLIENADGDRGLVAENIDDLIYISSYLVSYMSFNPDSSTSVALADTHASSVFAFNNINNIKDIKIQYSQNQPLIIENVNPQETIFECTGSNAIEDFRNYYSTHPEEMSFDALITLTFEIDGDIKRRAIRKTMPNLFKFDDIDNYKIEHFNGFNIPYFDGKVFNDILTPYDYSFETNNIGNAYGFTLKFHTIPIIHHTIVDTGIIGPNTFQEGSTASFFTYEDLGIYLNSTYVPGTLAYSQISYITDVQAYQGALKNICGGFSSSGSSSSPTYYSFQLPMQMQSPFVIQNAQEPVVYLTNNSKHWVCINDDLNDDLLSFKLCYINSTPGNYGIHTNYNVHNCVLDGTEIIYNNGQ